jgi:hypothetical protein
MFTSDSRTVMTLHGSKKKQVAHAKHGSAIRTDKKSVSADVAFDV